MPVKSVIMFAMDVQSILARDRAASEAGNPDRSINFAPLPPRPTPTVVKFWTTQQVSAHASTVLNGHKNTDEMITIIKQKSITGEVYLQMSKPTAWKLLGSVHVPAAILACDVRDINLRVGKSKK